MQPPPLLPQRLNHSFTVPLYCYPVLQAPAKKAKTETGAVKKPAAPAAAAEGASNTCFVGNLSWNTDEDSLRAAFEGFEISHVRIGECGAVVWECGCVGTG